MLALVKTPFHLIARSYTSEIVWQQIDQLSWPPVRTNLHNSIRNVSGEQPLKATGKVAVRNGAVPGNCDWLVFNR